jgi:hypothetical protein
VGLIEYSIIFSLKNSTKSKPSFAEKIGVFSWYVLKPLDEMDFMEVNL